MTIAAGEDTAWLQAGATIRVDWGRAGAARSAAAGCITVIVDTLTFSTTVALAVGRDIVVVPADSDDEAGAIARATGHPHTVPRADARPGRFTLAPASVRDALVVPRALIVHSPNGARCTRAADGAPAIFVGALVNATATATAVQTAMDRDARSVTVVACGERWRRATHDEGVRFAIEDLLGAGAIIRHLRGERSPEAEVAARTYDACAGELATLVGASGTGRELSALGFADDWQSAIAVDVCERAALVADGWAGRAIYPLEPMRAP